MRPEDSGTAVAPGLQESIKDFLKHLRWAVQEPSDNALEFIKEVAGGTS